MTNSNSTRTIFVQTFMNLCDLNCCNKPFLGLMYDLFLCTSYYLSLTSYKEFTTEVNAVIKNASSSTSHRKTPFFLLYVLLEKFFLAHAFKYYDYEDAQFS